MNEKRKTPASRIALGGVLAALAVVIMSLGGLIPVMTYVSPMLCALLLKIVLELCGVRIAWAWYGAVALLAALLSADKEAAAVFIFLGYYPIVKPQLRAEFEEFSTVMLVVMLLMGNVTFFLLDRLLQQDLLRRGRR